MREGGSGPLTGARGGGLLGSMKARLTVTILTGLLVPLWVAGASLFPLEAVALGEGPFLNARERDAEYILAHEVDRFLVPFHEEAGLPARAESYPNWESTGLDGHVGGHYLTALAQMAVITDNPEFRERLDRMVAELARCQEAIGTGYVGGVRGGRRLWQELADGKVEAEPFTLNGVWVPWYNLHKTFAGLRDAWRVAGNLQARTVLIKLSDWCVDLLGEMEDGEIHAMLACEFGGMNEVLADVHAMTGDPRYLEAARKFSDRRILDPLLEGRDKLTGLHANTQIPKVIGYARIATLADEADWMRAARFFRETVVNHRSVAIGGNSVSEHFNPRDDFMPMIEHHEGPETCNTYNMLRLTEILFEEQPSAALADYYERALYNHILSSQHPDRGGFVYFTPLRPRHYRVYSQPGLCFWCCVGSGMENHGKYGRFIYAREDPETLLVNLFIPSELNCKEHGLILRQKTDFPYTPQTRLELHLEKPRTFTLRIRRPAWAGDGFAVTGSDLGFLAQSESLHNPQNPRSDPLYLSIRRRWKDGDVVTVDLPMSLRLEPLPDETPYAALAYGPVVLGACVSDRELEGLIAEDGRMAHSAQGPKWPLEGAPVLEGPAEAILKKIHPVNDQPLEFELKTGGKRYRLRPFYEIHDCRYMIYWKVPGVF